LDYFRHPLKRKTLLPFRTKWEHKNLGKTCQAHRAWRIDPSCAGGAHGNCAHCAKDPEGQSAHRALQELPNHSAMPLAGLARAKVDHPYTPVQTACYHPAPLQAPSDNLATAMDVRTSPAAGPANELSGSDHPGSTTQDHKPSVHAPPAVPLTTPPQVDSPQPLPHAAGAQTGAPDRLARTSTAPRPGANSSSPASVHPSERPRELVSPTQPTAQGNGGFQHAPAPRESTTTLTESVGAQTGALDRPARKLTAHPGAYSSSSAPVHPARGPRELAM